MSDIDTELFMQEMQDVAPIKVVERVELVREQLSEGARKARQEAAQREQIKDGNHLRDDLIELLDPYYPLSFVRNGIQHNVFRKLKQGKYHSEARLDLHRMTVEKARHEVFEFIRQSVAYDLRSVMIVHGKGNHSRSSGAMLKSYVNQWLPDMPEVQAFASAQPHHGGVGAVYVLLRKSDREKEQNRIRITKGRVFGG